MRKILALSLLLAVTGCAESGGTFTGEFTYMADAALFRPCDDLDSRLPVQGPAYLELERAYLEARPGPGEPVFVELEGSIEEAPAMEGDGTVPTLMVTRVVRMDPSGSCLSDDPS
jgi:uncharacterized lipoprotein NlpE involved in copper resistance